MTFLEFLEPFGITIQEEDGFGLRPNIGMREQAQTEARKSLLDGRWILIAPAPYSAPAAYYFQQ
jgi:Fe(3+) dicitrate transport protein